MPDQEQSSGTAEKSAPENGQAPAPAIELGAEIPELVSEEEGAALARDGLPEAGEEPTSAQANNALASMLSTAPPPLPVGTFDMKELAERMKVESFPVKLRGLTDNELEKISDRSTKPPTKEQRKMGMTIGRPDQQRMKRLIVATAMVEPPLDNPQLLEKYGPSSEHVVMRWFLSGEIDQLCEAVNDMSGFSAGAVERAK